MGTSKDMTLHATPKQSCWRTDRFRGIAEKTQREIAKVNRASLRAQYVMQSSSWVFPSFHPDIVQRQQDDNKNKKSLLRGEALGQRGKSSKNAVFRGKRHDNKILKVQILLSSNFVVVAQAPICWGSIWHLPSSCLQRISDAEGCQGEGWGQ